MLGGMYVGGFEGGGRRAYVESGSRHFWACLQHLYIDSLRLRPRRKPVFCNFISHKALLPTTHFPATFNLSLSRNPQALKTTKKKKKITR
jgi:hypothetical protein